MWTVLDNGGAAIAQLGMCQTEDVKVPGSIPGLDILSLDRPLVKAKQAKHVVPN